MPCRRCHLHQRLPDGPQHLGHQPPPRKPRHGQPAPTAAAPPPRTEQHRPTAAPSQALPHPSPTAAPPRHPGQPRRHA
jgi:hypothetical protein